MCNGNGTCDCDYYLRFFLVAALVINNHSDLHLHGITARRRQIAGLGLQVYSVDAHIDPLFPEQLEALGLGNLHYLVSPDSPTLAEARFPILVYMQGCDCGSESSDFGNIPTIPEDRACLYYPQVHSLHTWCLHLRIVDNVYANITFVLIYC